MSEMIELVARAIATNKRSPAQRTPEIIDKAWPAYCGQARAAIEAMREPSDQMYFSGERTAAKYTHDGRWTVSFTTDVWAAMIDAALSDPKP